MAAAPDLEGRSETVLVRPLRRRDRARALRRLRDRARDDLFLIDLVRQVGDPITPDVTSDVIAAWRGGELVGLASLRPTLVLESGLERRVLEAMMGTLSDLGSG